MASCCRSPPLSVSARIFRRSPSTGNRSKTSCMAARPLGAGLRHMPPSRRFSSTVSSGTVERPSGTRATPIRTMSSALWPVMQLAVELAAARVAGFTSPARVRMSVDLPAPLAPMTAVTSPRGTSSETCDSAWTGP